MDTSYDISPSDSPAAAPKLTRPRTIMRLWMLERMLPYFSPFERLALYILAILLAGSTLALLAGLNSAVSVTVPAHGGMLREAIVGAPRFLNPILTISQSDEDLSALVYSGLMRALPDGTIVPDLASSYSISTDGTTYTFTLRPDATWSDGKPVTADDVLFTVQLAQDQAMKSSHRADWEGVQTSAPDAHTVQFKLPHAYAPFIENTTLGILPKHIWQNVTAEDFPFNPANMRPVGSGPYTVASVATDQTGSATRYELASNPHFALGEPSLAHISILFYPNEAAEIAALNSHDVDAAAGVAPASLTSVTRSDLAIATVALPRVFGVFFNQSHAAVLSDSSVRQALDAALDKQQIVQAVLGGYGAVLNGPIPPEVAGNVVPATAQIFASSASSSSATNAVNTGNAAAARAILQKGGWTFASANNVWTKGSGKSAQTLTFTLATADEPELIATAQAVAAQWRAAGITVAVHVYPLSELNTTVIRPRDYDAILFGEVVGRSLDLFAFWHSSQRNDPGLNLAMYANSSVDTILATARATTDEKQRDKLYEQFAAAIQKDAPAVFLYAPDFVYLVPRSLQGVQLGALTSASERFSNVYQWYTDTEHVWSIFTK